MPRPSLWRKCKVRTTTAPKPLCAPRVSTVNRRVAPSSHGSKKSIATLETLDTNMAGSASLSFLPTATAQDERLVVPHFPEASCQSALEPAGDVQRREDQTEFELMIPYRRFRALFNSDSAMCACTVTEAWKITSTAVRALAQVILPQVAWHTLSPATQAELMNWAPKCQDYMESEHTGACK